MLQNKLVFIITKNMFLNKDSKDKLRISNEQSLVSLPDVRLNGRLFLLSRAIAAASLGLYPHSFYVIFVSPTKEYFNRTSLDLRGVQTFPFLIKKRLLICKA